MTPVNGWTKEKMISHVEKEFKGKAITEANSFRCQYLTKDGKKCAVGMFIPEGSYEDCMDEGVGPASELFRVFTSLLTVMPLTGPEMQDFQGVHDSMSEHLTMEEQKAELIDWIRRNVSGEKS